MTGTARLLLARGARVAERALVTEIEALTAEAIGEAGEPAADALALPVRVLVPSHSLRLHLATELVRRRGRAVAGVHVQTLFGAALEVLERSGEAPPRGRLLFDVLARRLAREEDELAVSLEPLADGYAAVAGTVRDLLDAGFTPEHEGAAHEALAADGPAVASRAEVRRARALVRVTAHLSRGAEALGVGRSSTLLALAAEKVAADPRRALPSRAVLVHGFADATGVALDLLEAILRHPRGTLVLDHPPDPTGAAAEGEEPADGEARFTARLRERLSAVLEPVVEVPEEPAEETEAASPPGRTCGRPRGLATFAAGTAEAEAREVAVRVRLLLDRGERPEGIGIAVRDLDLYRLPLRRHLTALGVPFSGIGAVGSLAPPGRYARALLDLMARGGDLPADRWLDASESLAGAPLPPRLRVDLRLAFFALGAGRVRDIAALEVDRYLRGGSYALPVRQGLRPGASPSAGSEKDADDDPDSDDAREAATGAAAPKRRVDGRHLRAAVAAASSLLSRLEEWPHEADSADHFRRLTRLLREDLGWSRRRPPAAGDGDGGPSTTAAPAPAAVLDALDQAAAEIPPRLVLRSDELRVLLARALDRSGWSPIGGAGGGVQLLGVLEARARTFDHLFVAGLSRGVFPRVIRPDPLLPDELRRILSRVLPDVPIKQRGFSEERYLFAQLLSASPHVILSWPVEGTDGRPLPPSPLVERLLAVTGERWRPARAPALWASGGGWTPRDATGTAPAAASDPRPAVRPAREHAVLAALHAPRQSFAAVLPSAVAEARQELITPRLELETGRVAAARLAVLAELDPDLSTREGRLVRRRLGPYFGFVGGLAGAPADDPRRRDLFVTVLERIAACPWQVFLERLLRVEPTPDPVQSLPDIDPLLLGNAVHRVLERLVVDALGEPPESLETARDRQPVEVPWPETDELVRLLREVTADLVVEDGVALRGMARALAARALPVLDGAAKLDWGHGPLVACGAEVRGEIELPDADGSVRRLGFKADRADPATGGLLLTDYKTGRPISDKKQERTRRQHFLRDVAAGKRLQAVAYALAAGVAAGRYAYLKPDLEHREFTASADDGELVEAFEAAVAAAFADWDAGAFFPRVVDPDGRREPIGCSYCAVAEACLRGDSGARGRLAGWTARHAVSGTIAAESADGRDEAEEDEIETVPTGTAEAALLGVWDLPRTGSRR